MDKNEIIHTRRTHADLRDGIYTYYLEVLPSTQPPRFIMIHTYTPIDIKPLQAVDLDLSEI